MTTIAQFLSRLVAADGAATLAATLPERFAIERAGPYPLVRHVALPDSEEGGELLLELQEIGWGPLRIEALVPDPDAGEIEIALAPGELSGRYALFGLEGPAVDLDTGGGLAPLTALAAADPTPTPTPTPQITPAQFDQLMQANAQRDKLNGMCMGQKLVGTYDTYNDDYNDVFQTNGGLRNTWAQNGATAAMMDYTSNALNTGTTVNPPASEQTFGTANVSYNSNAFTQALAVWAACAVAQKPDAAKAVATFKTGVINDTGNSSSTTNPMTGPQVYASVAAASASSPTSAPADHPLHLALTRFVAGTHDENDAAVFDDHDVTEEQLDVVRRVFEAGQRVHDPKQRIPVHDGECRAQCPAPRFRFGLTEQPNGAITVKLRASTFSLDAIDFGMEAWPGAAGEAARERVASAAFIRGLLEDRLSSQLTRLLRRLGADADPC